ncbi:TolB family protein [Micromonospora citrea]|uniref:TolB family protein n=1 Tax=Micromonospora citrea TaxID=47855 RepID=UPI003C54F973
MSRPMEDALRAAVHELSDQVRPVPDLAGSALRRGRRLRARRRATATGAALVAVIAVTVPFVLLRPAPATRVAIPEPQPTTLLHPVPDTRWKDAPLVLPGGWVVTGGVLDGSGHLLDRTRDRYVRTQGYDEVWPAPTGTVTAVADEDRPGQIGLIDARKATVRWYRAPGSDPQWSPDGRRLLLTGLRQDTTQFGLLDLNGRFQQYTVDRTKFFCTDYCAFTWTRDGREVTLPLTDAFKERTESARHPRWGVQFFSAEDGRPTRFVKIPGDPAGPWVWSPDGRRVVVQGQHDPVLVDAATGTVVRKLPSADVAWVTNDRLLYRRPYGSRDVVLADPEGRERERQPLPRELVELNVTVAPR